jgi:GT2 family glycosyltransferase
MVKINASIVLYHNNKEQVLKAIASFLNTNLKVKLYLIDNSLNDDLKELSNIDDRIEYIFNNVNLGYGSAHNIAIRESIKNNISYHVVLNPDIYFKNDVIEKLSQYMQNNNDVGHIMPKVLYPDGEIQHLTKLVPSPFDLIFRRFIPLKSWKEKRNFKYELRFSGYDKIANVPYLSGCFMFLRIEALQNVGMFDERFFMYPEDIDLTRRIHKKYKTIYYPFVSIVHEHEKASFKSFKMMKIHMFNMIKYFNKWGWFFDSERKLFNKQILDELGYEEDK